MVRISLTILRLYSFSAWWNCQISFNKGFWHLSSLTSFLRESFVPLKSPICYIKVLIALKSICIVSCLLITFDGAPLESRTTREIFYIFHLKKNPWNQLKFSNSNWISKIISVSRFRAGIQIFFSQIDLSCLFW